MSAACSSSLSCPAFSDDGTHAKFHHSKLHHRLGSAQATISSSFFSGEGFRQPRHNRFLLVEAQLSRPFCVCKLSDYGGILHNRNYHDGCMHKAASLSSSLFLGACACNGSPLQFELRHLFLTEPFPCFAHAGFGGLSHKRLTSAWAHSQQHLSLKEDQERLLRSQERREALKLYQATILDSITQHLASFQQSALLSTNSQNEGVSGRYVPAGFDISACRSVFVGNMHKKVTDTFLTEIFSTVGPLVACKVIKKLKSSYGFVEYQDHHAAAMAISTLNGRKLFKLPIRVNWAFPGAEKERLPAHYTVFVGDLSPHVTEDLLFKLFSTYPSCLVAQVVWDTRNGKSKGYGFVSFREREDAEKAIEEMTGKVLFDKAIRCAWAVGKQTNIDEPPEQEGEKILNVIKDNPRYTTVYVGNIERQVTPEELHEFFNGLGAGAIEDVQIARRRGYGFVRYSNHEEAALAIQAADGKIIRGWPIKCSWGTKPNTLLGASDSLPLASLADQPSEPSPNMASVQPV